MVGAEVTPKGRWVYRCSPWWVLIVTSPFDASSKTNCWYACKYVKGGEELPYSQGWEDLLWLTQWMLSNLQGSIHSDLVVPAKPECIPFDFGTGMIGDAQ